MTALEERVVRVQGSGFSKEEPEPKVSKAPSRFARYFTKSGWVHAVLLVFVWLFVFPFLWMVFTSLKTDEELPEGAILPHVPTFRASSPYVKSSVTPVRPVDVTVARWKELLPRLTEVAAKRVAGVQAKVPEVAGMVPVDPAEHRKSAASSLVNFAVGKLNKDLWNGEDAPLMAAYGDVLTDEAVRHALRQSLASLEMLSFQIRTLDFHIHSIDEGPGFLKDWVVESGPGRLVKAGDAVVLTYDFSRGMVPVVLRRDFELPAGVKPSDLHKIIVSVKADDSWHGVNAELDVGGVLWKSVRTTYLAQHRAMSFLFQPPTFDDQMLRPKNWVSLKADGAGQVAGQRQARLRVIITPSNTVTAIWGKVIRNYLRAFDTVPFWHYIGNSLVLVALTTLGSLFSASFVAYAFARLHWPGKSLALVILLSTMMLPPQVTMIPGFMIWRGLHWYNTLNPLWVPAFFGTAFFIFLMIQHMRTIPRDLEEAARIDGLNAVQSWYYIILPNVKPTLAAIAILSFMGSWNEFLQPLIYLRDQAKFPLALGLYGLKVDQFNPEQPDWTLIMAGDILMVIPVILVFFLFQRYFVQGMTLTGMKG